MALARYSTIMHHADHIATKIFTLLQSRADGATVCPSEVARALEPVHWRPLMQRVREVAVALAEAGKVSKLSQQRRLNVRPRVAGFGSDVRVCFAAIELSGELGGHWRSRRRVETIPQSAHQLDPLLGGQFADLFARDAMIERSPIVLPSRKRWN